MVNHFQSFIENIIENHLKLVEEAYIFYLDPTLLNLKVYSFTFIYQNVNLISS
jgi:hypothetical protein